MDKKEHTRTIENIIILPILGITVCLIPYVIPRLRASKLADNASRIYFIIILSILLEYNMTKKAKSAIE